MKKGTFEAILFILILMAPLVINTVTTLQNYKVKNLYTDVMEEEEEENSEKETEENRTEQDIREFVPINTIEILAYSDEQEHNFLHHPKSFNLFIEVLTPPPEIM